MFADEDQTEECNESCDAGAVEDMASPEAGEEERREESEDADSEKGDDGAQEPGLGPWTQHQGEGKEDQDPGPNDGLEDLRNAEVERKKAERVAEVNFIVANVFFDNLR